MPLFSGTTINASALSLARRANSQSGGTVSGRQQGCKVPANGVNRARCPSWQEGLAFVYGVAATEADADPCFSEARQVTLLDNAAGQFTFPRETGTLQN